MEGQTKAHRSVSAHSRLHWHLQCCVTELHDLHLILICFGDETFCLGYLTDATKNVSRISRVLSRVCEFETINWFRRYFGHARTQTHTMRIFHMACLRVFTPHWPCCQSFAHTALSLQSKSHHRYHAAITSFMFSRIFNMQIKTKSANNF
jgi:hypothetical protein